LKSEGGVGRQAEGEGFSREAAKARRKKKKEASDFPNGSASFKFLMKQPFLAFFCEN
jgi:hypothetical protein